MDIVERLKAKPPKGFVTSPLMIEAADEIERLRGQSRMNWDAFQKAATEIERLREALREIASIDYRGPMPDGVQIARKALGEKE